MGQLKGQGYLYGRPSGRCDRRRRCRADLLAVEPLTGAAAPGLQRCRREPPRPKRSADARPDRSALDVARPQRLDGAPMRAPSSRCMASATTSSCSTRARSRCRRSTAPLARALADRQTGIGCDQLILLEPSDTADFRMRIFNADGGEVEACGNATRAVGLLHGEPAQIETLGGILATSPAEGGDCGRHGRAALRLGRDPAGLCDGHACTCRSAGTSSKVPSPSMSAIRTRSSSSTTAMPCELERLGPLIEHDPLFPERVNVNVATVVDRDDDPPARVGTRRRADARLRHRRLRHGGRRDAARA